MKTSHLNNVNKLQMLIKCFLCEEINKVFLKILLSTTLNSDVNRNKASFICVNERKAFKAVVPLRLQISKFTKFIYFFGQITNGA